MSAACALPPSALSRPPLRVYNPPDLSPRERDVLAAVRDHGDPPRKSMTFDLARAIGLRVPYRPSTSARSGGKGTWQGISEPSYGRSNRWPWTPAADAVLQTLRQLASRGLLNNERSSENVSSTGGDVGILTVGLTATGAALLPPGPPDLLRTMMAFGWKPGAPDSLGNEPLAVDREQVTTSMRCGGCRRPGLSFRPMHLTWSDRSTQYGAYAVCLRPECGFAERV